MPKRVQRIEKKCVACNSVFTVLPCHASKKWCTHNCFLRNGTFRHNKPHTEESKKKMRDNVNPNSKDSQFKKGHSGHVNSGSFKKGDKPWNDNGGKRSLSQILKDDIRYKKWRIAVFQRDDYTCQKCGKRGVELNADHIKEKCNYPELAFDIDNGRTLCVPCHRKTKNYGGRANKLINR